MDYRDVYGAARERPDMQRNGRKLAKVSPFPFNDYKVVSLTSLFPVVPIIGIGPRLELDNETVLRAFGMRTDLGKDSIVQIVCVLSCFYRFLVPLLSQFGEAC